MHGEVAKNTQGCGVEHGKFAVQFEASGQALDKLRWLLSDMAMKYLAASLQGRSRDNLNEPPYFEC
jgi:hypothetical protein